MTQSTIYIGSASSTKNAPTIYIEPAGSLKSASYGYLGVAGSNRTVLSPPPPASPPAPPSPNFTVNGSGFSSTSVQLAVGQTVRVTFTLTLNNNVSTPGTLPVSMYWGGGSVSHVTTANGPNVSASTATGSGSTYIDITGKSAGSDTVAILAGGTDANGNYSGYASNGSGTYISVTVTSS